VAKVAWGLYPVLVTFVVVATANHFLVDVFLGMLTAAFAATVAHRVLARARPDVWTFHPGGRTQPARRRTRAPALGHATA
jgi:hypothetical protein